MYNEKNEGSCTEIDTISIDLMEIVLGVIEKFLFGRGIVCSDLSLQFPGMSANIQESLFIQISIKVDY